MKKITAITLLSLTLVACKQDKKTITKIDPVTGDTIKIEASSAEDSLKIVKEMDAKAAIKDSAGVYTQTLKLEKGKTYPFTTVQKESNTAAISTGKKQSMSRESSDVVTFTVNDFKDGVYDMAVNFISKKTTFTAEGKTVVIDTQKPSPTVKEEKEQWAMDKALNGNKLNMKMKENGEIISITGFDAIYTKFSNTVNSLTKDPQARKFFTEQTKASFNEAVLKDQFTKNFFILPKGGAKLGQTWTVTEKASEDGSVKINTNYTLKKVENGVAEIAISGGIPRKSDKQSQGEVTRSMSSELTQNGTMRFDINSGWILDQKINVKTEQKETLSDGKQSQSMTNTTVTSIVVNP